MADGPGSAWSNAYQVIQDAVNAAADGVPDWWYHGYGLNPISTTVTTGDDDSDTFNNELEWIADTDPTNTASYFRVSAVSNNSPV